MAIAWLITIGVFLAGYFTTVAIFDGVKERDQIDLAQLESQSRNLGSIETTVLKKAV